MNNLDLNAGLDLNVENYELSDLLNLFKLDIEFDENDMRRVKKSVMLSHPDKSGMDKKYFLFFVNAYKVLFSVYEYRNKGNKTKMTEYNNNIDELTPDHEAVMRKFKKCADFNTTFNDLFKKTRMSDSDIDNGYGDWIKSEEDVDLRTTTLHNMSDAFERKKREVKDIAIYNKETDEIGNGGNSYGYDLARDKPELYSSAVFSKLAFNDLKQSYAESVIPVTIDDYNNKVKFNSVDEMIRSPGYNVVPMCDKQATEYLINKNRLSVQTDTQRAFRMSQQDEQSRKSNQSLLRIVNILE